jgi:putative restriction endonuclease
MKEGQTLWTRDELILAINLYCKTPFGKLHKGNPDVVNLANLIGRTSNSVAYKLVNFASLDPTLKARGIKGASNSSKLDKQIWDEFFDNWNILPYESELLLENFQNRSIEKFDGTSNVDFSIEGKTIEQLVKVRVNQSFFRSAILASYNNTCCITGIKQPELLIAGHIKPWSIDEKNRLNPCNGIAINALHDKAFETGLMTITSDYKIKISSLLFKEKNKPINEEYFLKYDNKEIILPTRFLPNIDFLEYHNRIRFKP